MGKTGVRDDKWSEGEVEKEANREGIRRGQKVLHLKHNHPTVLTVRDYYIDLSGELCLTFEDDEYEGQVIEHGYLTRSQIWTKPQILSLFEEE